MSRQERNSVTAIKRRFWTKKTGSTNSAQIYFMKHYIDTPKKVMAETDKK
jgi:hypothetical protein